MAAAFLSDLAGDLADDLDRDDHRQEEDPADNIKNCFDKIENSVHFFRVCRDYPPGSGVVVDACFLKRGCVSFWVNAVRNLPAIGSNAGDHVSC